MRRYFSMIAILFAINIAMFAQSDSTEKFGFIGGLSLEEINSLINQDITQFMGIPIDGTEKEMVKKLKKKGFRKYLFDSYKGKFNGGDVLIKITTNNSKVCGIGVADIVSRDESGIKKRYNNLCDQFLNNERYNRKDKYALKIEDYIILDDEDISYNMREHNKNYEVTFHQRPNMDLIRSKIQFENLSEAEQEYIMSTAELHASFCKRVTFKIIEFESGYRIMMAYINENNLPDGEDL